jgi:hypothetical protein
MNLTIDMRERHFSAKKIMESPVQNRSEGMQGVRLVSLLLVLGFLAPMPAAAFHARYLEVVIDRGGDATVTFEYTLSFLEQCLAFLGFISPDKDIGQILGASTGGEVETLLAARGATLFSVKDFAMVGEDATGITCYTPTLNLSWGQAGYESSILAPLLEPDFSPDVTIIRFPDAYSLTLRDQLVIPNLTHTF